MVSRQETARPLLTPGEVMQLPPEDAVVMVSSVAPIRAKKLRYYVDANFKDRVLPPPVLAVGRYADAPPARPDDWSGLAIPAVPTAPTSVSADGPGGTDDGGPRRQLELSETVAYEPELDACANDLELLDDDDLALPLPGQLDPAMQRTARLASRPQRRNRPMSQYRLNLSSSPSTPSAWMNLPPRKACPSPPSSQRPWRPGCHPMRATSVRPPLPSGWIDCRGRPNAWSATRTSRSKRWRCSSAIS